MILLENDHPIVKNVLSRKMVVTEGSKPESVDTTLSDDDGSIFHIHSADKERTKIMVEFTCPFFKDLKGLNIESALTKKYADYEVAQPNGGHSFAFLIDIEKFSGKIEKVAKDFSLLRYHLYECIFDYFFAAMNDNKSEKVLLNISGNEKMFIESKSDRTTVTFCFDFQTEEDITIGKIFLHEYKEGRKGGNAPQALVSYKEPPTELAGLKVPSGNNVGYLTFVLTKSYHAQPANQPKTVEHMSSFLQYFKMHMKCSKSYLNQRMRSKCEGFVKILNRARPETKSTEKKTFSGKTFNRA